MEPQDIKDLTTEDLTDEEVAEVEYFTKYVTDLRDKILANQDELVYVEGHLIKVNVFEDGTTMFLAFPPNDDIPDNEKEPLDMLGTLEVLLKGAGIYESIKN